MFEWTKSQIIVLTLSFLIALIIALVLRKFLNGKSEIIRRIPLIIVTILLIGLEIAKQTVGFAIGYSYSILPLQFCSTFYIWFSLAQFTKGGFQRSMQIMSVVSAIIMVVMLLISPFSLIGYSTDNIFLNFSNFHTFTFHYLVIVYLFISFALKLVHPKYEDSFTIVICFFAYFIVGVIAAFDLGVNFMTILYGTVASIERMRLAVGQIAYDLILLFSMLMFGISVVLILTKFYKIKLNKKNKKRN